MALDSLRSFNNAIAGQPMVGADVNIFDIHATPRFAVGTRFLRSDGNIYVYGYSGSGTSKGLVVAPTFASSGKATTGTVVATASAVAVSGDTILPGTVGSRYIEITLATITANQLAGGYLLVETGSGAGYTYRIKGNTATGTPASGNIRIELREPLQSTVSPNTSVNISPCPWNDFTAADPTTNNICIGVSCSTTTTSKPYGWVCTAGQIGVLQQGTIVAGQAVMLSTSVNGAVTVFGGVYTTVAQLLGLQALGTCTTIGADAKYCTILLNLSSS